MKKQRYLELLMQQGSNWIKYSLLNPSKNMRPIHISLHRIALRKMGVDFPVIERR